MKLNRVWSSLKNMKIKSPKEFKIHQISAKMACEYNSYWHSRLPKIHWSNVVRNTHYVCYGAFIGLNCYAVGIWSSPVAQNRFKDGKQILELRRYAIKEEAPKFTASWMLGKMEKEIAAKFSDIKRLISYQDTEVHKGTIYKASNWVATNTTKNISWTTQNRKRNKEQATGDKIRWEKLINNQRR